MTPIARLFLRLGISPDVVTVVGTVGVCVGALVFFPRGQLLVGTLVVIVLFIFSDNVDGVMARMSGTPGPLGGLSWTPPSTGSVTPRSSGAWCSTSPAVHANLHGRRPRAGLPHPRVRRQLLQGPCRGPGDDRERRDRRARRPAAGRAARHLPRGGRGPRWCCSSSCSPCCAVASLVTVVQRMVAVRRQVPGDVARPEPHSLACRRREPSVTTSRATGLRALACPPGSSGSSTTPPAGSPRPGRPWGCGRASPPSARCRRPRHTGCSTLIADISDAARWQGCRPAAVELRPKVRPELDPSVSSTRWCVSRDAVLHALLLQRLPAGRTGRRTSWPPDGPDGR